MDQQQEVQVEEGIDLIALFKLLLSKVKILILAVLIGGVLGGCFAVWRTVNVNHYGTRVEFYVNPEKEKDALDDENGEYGVHGAYGKPVMDGMIKLLSSESFAEKMILNGQDLPEKDVWVNEKAEAEVALDLNTKIDVAQVKITALNAEKKELNDWKELRIDKAKEETDAKKVLDELWLELFYDNVVTSANPNEQEYRKNVKSAVEGTKEYTTKVAYENWDAIREEIKDLDEKIEDKKELLVPIQQETDGVLEVALEAWRQTAKYKAELAKYSGAMKFSYLKNESASSSSDEARSFVYVEISVLNDVEFAKELLNRVKSIVPTYIEQKMTVPDGYAGTNCERITRTDDIHLTNPGYTTKQAVKFGALAAIVALVIACAAIIMIDKTDKRLRDTAIITKQFNVPVLGHIPSIEEMNEGVPEKKNEKEAE